MPHLDFVAQAQRSPSTCICCGNHNGPFIDMKMEMVSIATAIGVQQLSGAAYLCVGNEENPGCAVQIGRLTGVMVDASKLAEMKEHAETLNQEIVELRASLSKKSLKVEDVLVLIGREREASAV